MSTEHRFGYQDVKDAYERIGPYLKETGFSTVEWMSEFRKSLHRNALQ